MDSSPHDQNEAILTKLSFCEVFTTLESEDYALRCRRHLQSIWFYRATTLPSLFLLAFNESLANQQGIAVFYYCTYHDVRVAMPPPIHTCPENGSIQSTMNSLSQKVELEIAKNSCCHDAVFRDNRFSSQNTKDQYTLKKLLNSSLSHQKLCTYIFAISKKSEQKLTRKLSKQA